MTVRISELNELSGDLAQSDLLPIVDASAGETKKIQASNLIVRGISGAPSSFIDLSKLNQSSSTKLAATVLSNTGALAGTYGSASTVAQLTVTAQGVVTFASGVPIVIPASGVTGLAPVATSGTYASLSGLPALGTLAQQDAGSIVVSGGTISGVTFVSGSVTISGGTISGITDLAIDDGGTGASSAADARTNLGLAIGSDVQAYSTVLSGVAEAYDVTDNIAYASASGVVATTPFTSFARSMASGATAADVRSTLGLGSIATQDAGSVVISGGTISGATLDAANVTISGGTIVAITDLSIEDGGTGASTASGARDNLGLTIGSGVQAYSAVLDGLAGAYDITGNIAYASASGVVATTTLTSLGRTIVSQTAASGVRNELSLGSMALQEASSVAISGGTISGITDLAIADGGTGASSAAAARTNLGLAIGTNVQAYDAGLASIAGLTTSPDLLIYTTSGDTYATTAFPAFARTMLASGSNASGIISSLGLGTLATKNIIDGSEITLATISGSVLASGTITSREIASGAVVSGAILAGNVVTSSLADDAVTAAKLADESTTLVEVGSPVGNGAFIGQQWLDSVTQYEYTWDGSNWQRQAAINEIAFVDSTPIAFNVAYPDKFSATITTTLDDQNAGTVFAGPTTGAATAPSFRALAPSDIPVATASTVGAVQPGAGLAVTAGGIINHSNSAIAGTYAGAVTIDAQGHIVSAQTSLQASDIPALDASKITTGAFGSQFLADNSVTASQLADYGIAQVSATAPIPEFAGQWWINPNDRSAYIWVGEVTPALNGYWLNLGYGSPTQINLRFGGTYNASGNVVESINSYGIEAGLTVGQALAAPSTSNNGVYLIVTTSGTGTTPAPSGVLSVGNWVLSQGIGASWTLVELGVVGETIADEEVLVAGASLTPAASGIASQEDFNTQVWPKVQIATTGAAGIVRASSEIVVASGTGIMSLGVVDDGSY